MKKNTSQLNHPFLLLIISVLYLLSACSTPTSPVSLDGQPQPQNAQNQDNLLVIDISSAAEIQSGENFSVNVNINNTSDLTAFELHLAFDPAKLEVVELKNGGLLTADFVVQNTFDNQAGTIDYAIAQIGRDPVHGSGSILEIVFLANASGSSDLLFRQTAASPLGALLSNSNGQAIEFTAVNGSVVIK